MVDVQGVIRTFLLAQSGIANLVNTRVFAGREVPARGYAPADGPAIAFKVRGGAGEYRGRDYEDALIEPSVQFKCYGRSEIEAFELYRALVDGLHNGHSATVLHGEEVGVGQPLEEAETEWPFVLAFFDVMVRSS